MCVCVLSDPFWCHTHSLTSPHYSSLFRSTSQTNHLHNLTRPYFPILNSSPSYFQVILCYYIDVNYLKTFWNKQGKLSLYIYIKALYLVYASTPLQKSHSFLRASRPVTKWRFRESCELREDTEALHCFIAP